MEGAATCAELEDCESVMWKLYRSREDLEVGVKDRAHKRKMDLWRCSLLGGIRSTEMDAKAPEKEGLPGNKPLSPSHALLESYLCFT